MHLPDNLFTMFTAELETRDGEPVITVPEREHSIGDLSVGQRYRVAILPQTNQAGGGGRETTTSHRHPGAESAATVEEGETRDVEIEDVGEQGDGIARIGPGYVVFVPGTNVGDRVTITITDVRETFAFAEVDEPEPLSE